ncbi:MAG: hypothetical protein GC134_07040 [Proteobacteria bacterium]|nr:hypothetical protein [Pseudomonadota bacterium]
MGINISQLGTVLDSSTLTVKKLSDAEAATFRQKMLEVEALQYQRPIIPEDHAFATVTVGGKVVAKITNNGYVESSNAWGPRLQSVLGDEKLQGPELAAERANAIAKAFGGTVHVADTALTQGEWEALPDVRWTIDTHQMIADGYGNAANYAGQSYQSAKTATAMIMALLQQQER